MKLLLVPVVLAALGQAGDDAEKRFKAMEDKIRQADALQVAFESDFKDNFGSIKGTLAVRTGNKASLDMRINLMDNPRKFLLVSDGTRMVTRTETLSRRDTPKFLRDALVSLTARVGVYACAVFQNEPDGDERNPLDDIKLSDFKALPNEKVNGRDAAVIAYKLTDRQTSTVTVWIDTATGLPLKRITETGMKGGGPSAIVETYRDFRLNPQLDAKLFELPNANKGAK
jgi:outer membrane lipoprotein-sorting protein